MRSMSTPSQPLSGGDVESVSPSPQSSAGRSGPRIVLPAPAVDGLPQARRSSPASLRHSSVLTRKAAEHVRAHSFALGNTVRRRLLRGSKTTKSRSAHPGNQNDLLRVVQVEGRVFRDLRAIAAGAIATAAARRRTFRRPMRSSTRRRW